MKAPDESLLVVLSYSNYHILNASHSCSKITCGSCGALVGLNTRFSVVNTVICLVRCTGLVPFYHSIGFLKLIMDTKSTLMAMRMDVWANGVISPYRMRIQHHLIRIFRRTPLNHIRSSM